MKKSKHKKKYTTNPYTPELDSNMTNIIIVTCNQIEYTKLCVESIRKYTEIGTYNIIAIDNNSSDGTQEWLSLQKDIIKIFNNENIGFPAACNQGIKQAAEGDILFLNNDTIVTSSWLKNLCCCLYSSKDIGAAGPVTNYCSNYQTIQARYDSIDGMQEFAQKHNKSDSLLWEQRLKLVGFPLPQMPRGQVRYPINCCLSACKPFLHDCLFRQRLFQFPF